MKKFFKFGGKGLKRSPSENSNQSSSWSINSGGSKDSVGKANPNDFKEKDFHKIHKAALNGDLEKLKEHLKKQAVDTTGSYTGRQRAIERCRNALDVLTWRDCGER